MPAEPNAEILFATDFCEPARRALAYAIRMARRQGYAVRALHVLDLTRGDSGEAISYTTAHDSAEQRLRQVRRELRLAGVGESATLIDGGRPARAIRQAAAHYAPALLVLGLNGARSRSPSALGATARALLTSAPCPVVTVSAAFQDSSVSLPFRNPLFVTDGDSAGFHAALHACPVPADGAPVRIVAAGGASRRIPRSRMKSFSPIVVDLERAATQIPDELEGIRPDLLVLSVRSGGVLDSFASGSLAHRLLTLAPCPVLTVRC